MISPSGHSQQSRSALSIRQTRAFTLAELLVVLAIITLLTALLLPAIERARAAARVVVCASNMRQVAAAMHLYASDSKGLFPANITGRTSWYDANVLGKYIPLANKDDSRGLTGPAVTCPDDQSAIRGFSMNVWAGNRADAFIENSGRGKMWEPAVKHASHMILVVEAWSSNGSPQTGFASPAVVGSLGTKPGRRFGAGGGLVPLQRRGPFGFVNSEIDFSRHRGSGGPGIWTEPRGRANIAYADGHVELKQNDELADYRTGCSTFNSLWNLMDYALDAQVPQAAP